MSSICIKCDTGISCTDAKVQETDDVDVCSSCQLSSLQNEISDIREEYRKYRHWVENYLDLSMLTPWDVFKKRRWCEACESYQDGICICYAR